jgi:hypothetical protein
VLVIKERVSLTRSPIAIFLPGHNTNRKTRLVTAYHIQLLIQSPRFIYFVSPTQTKDPSKATIRITPRLVSYLQVLARQLLHSGHRVVLVRVVQPRRQRLLSLQRVVQVVFPPTALLLICFTEVLHLPVHLPLGHPESRQLLSVSRLKSFFCDNRLMCFFCIR